MHYFHRIGPLGLVVAMSVCPPPVPFPCNFFSMDRVCIFAWTESAFWCKSVVSSRALKTGMCSGSPPRFGFSRMRDFYNNALLIFKDIHVFTVLCWTKEGPAYNRVFKFCRLVCAYIHLTSHWCMVV